MQYLWVIFCTVLFLAILGWLFEHPWVFLALAAVVAAFFAWVYYVA